MLSFGGDMTDHVRPVPIGVGNPSDKVAMPRPADSDISPEAPEFVRSLGDPLDNLFPENDQIIAPGWKTTSVASH